MTVRDRLLHVLWTKAVGTPGYDKKEWLEMERLLHASQTDAANAAASAFQLREMLVRVVDVSRRPFDGPPELAGLFAEATALLGKTP